MTVNRAEHATVVIEFAPVSLVEMCSVVAFARQTAMTLTVFANVRAVNDCDHYSHSIRCTVFVHFLVDISEAGDTDYFQPCNDDSIGRYTLEMIKSILWMVMNIQRVFIG